MHSFNWTDPESVVEEVAFEIITKRQVGLVGGDCAKVLLRMPAAQQLLGWVLHGGGGGGGAGGGGGGSCAGGSACSWRSLELPSLTPTPGRKGCVNCSPLALSVRHCAWHRNRISAS